MVEVLHHWDASKESGAATDGWLLHAVIARCIFGPKSTTNSILSDRISTLTLSFFCLLSKYLVVESMNFPFRHRW